MFPGLLAILILTAIVGTTLLTLGLRGRRVNDHPICRKCKFDLVGLYPGGDRCPECGARLESRTVRHGCRRRRLVVIAIGAVALMISLAGGGAVTWMRIKNVQWYDQLPVTWVFRDAKSNNLAVADRGRQELFRRLVDNLLTAKECEPILEHVLRVQSEPAELWDTGWGDLFEMSIPRGYCTDQQIKQYVQQGIEFHAIVRPRVTAGNPGGMSFQFIQGKYASFGFLPYAVETLVESVSVGNIECERLVFSGRGTRGESNAADALAPGSSLWKGAELHPLPDAPGLYPVRIVATIEAQPMSMLQDGTLGVPLDEPALVWKLVVEGQMEIVSPQAEPDLRLVVEPGLQEAVQEVFRVERVFQRGPGRLKVVLSQDRESPVDLVMDLVARYQGREVFRSDLLNRKGQAPMSGTAHFGIQTNLDLGIDGPVEILLVPDPDDARRSGDLLEVWGEEIPLGTFEVEKEFGDD